VLEKLFLNGSLLKSEIVSLLSDQQSSLVERAIEELIANNYLVGAQSYLILQN
jgi:hypothetical protein